MASVTQAVSHDAVTRSPVVATADRRITSLDGFRGLATIFVILSHYFGEVEHGIAGLMLGWIGVDMFFVLSGFLIGKLILEKRHHENFFTIFYVRRFFRIIPAYIITVFAVVLLLDLCPPEWSDPAAHFPTWTYLAFVQGFWMTWSNSIGAHWLAPTWTLAVEEHFYLLAPAAIVFIARRRLIWLLAIVGVAAVALRAAAIMHGPQATMAGLVMLPGRADLLVLGILGAIAFKTQLDWRRITPFLRWVPLIALLIVFAMGWLDRVALYVIGPAIMAVGCACFIVGLATGIPESATFQSRFLRFFGDNGYCLYLVHLPVLGLMHGLILGSVPDIESASQWAVTLAALPVAIGAGWVMTKLIEEPCTAFGRRWAWAKADESLAAIPNIGSATSGDISITSGR